jgi:hypothetical protein
LSVRPSLPVFLSFLTASPYLESLSLQAGGLSPYFVEDLLFDGEFRGPWADIIPAHPTIPTLSNLRMLLIKYLEPGDAVEILVALRSVLNRTSGRLAGLKTFHLGDVSGLPEWGDEEQSILPLVGELKKVLPLPGNGHEEPGGAGGLRALSLTGFKDRFTSALTAGGFEDGLKALTALEVFNSVTTLRLVFCDGSMFSTLQPRVVDMDESTTTMSGKVVLPMPRLSGLWMERCEGSGFHYADIECDPRVVEGFSAPLKTMLFARKGFFESPPLSTPLHGVDVPCDTIKVVGYARRDMNHLTSQGLESLRTVVDRIDWWGREEGEVEVSAVDEPMSREEEDEMLIREAEEIDDPEFEYYCELIYRKQVEQGVDEDDEGGGGGGGVEEEMENMELGPVIVGAQLPTPPPLPAIGMGGDEELIGYDEEPDFEETLPTPRGPYQTFLNNINIDDDPLANYHRYMNGEEFISTFRQRNDGMFEIEENENGSNADMDSIASSSTSTYSSTARSSPSVSTFSLPTSITASETTSVCGGEDRDRESDDTAVLADLEKVGLFRDEEFNFEREIY